ncbi:LuxR C-terminal-related transcriptional regulator [Calothrix sp. 336/3]|uniref:LuxR C-terminal-related transcriptional regulator n=1 Tax=Calothrix sp. 336/3 TaxID=1337936 RepID=UPI0004E3FBAF|nr:LuxR C-terminal-related transcriptional regulator [Calothrix sp. 336/3]AKG21124.1 transcriptional regulator [Calothrix sp. 336/3]
MVNSLQNVFMAIASADDEEQLRLAVEETVGEHFDVQRWGIYLLEQPQAVSDNNSQIPGICINSNPVGQYVVERHAPTHEQLVLPSEKWQQICPRDDHAHVMSGPIIYDGRLVGTLNLTRESGNRAFDANDLADLSALCLHLSTKIATLRAKTKTTNANLVSPLTPRELQIAQLVAQGLTNAEIGEKLWISQNSVKQALKRMFRKLQVSARAEMVAKLQDI